jgi:hypothetical protein
MKGMKSTKSNPKRMRDAGENYKRLKEEISPFIRKRSYSFLSTAGRWFESSSLIKKD